MSLLSQFKKYLSATQAQGVPSTHDVDRLQQAIDLALTIEGQISAVEVKILIQLASAVPPSQVIVEIGNYRGRSTVALALGTQIGNGNRIYSIDPHLEFQGILGGEFGPQDMAALYTNLTRANVGSSVATICLPSTTAAKAWMDQNIGLLWLDGDHRYAAVLADVTAWLPFVNAGSVVAFHDIDSPDVQRLLDELVQSGQLIQIGQVEAIAWFEKVKRS